MVLNAEGKQIQRCKNPELVMNFFVHYRWATRDEPIRTGLDGMRLFLDGYEYNPPILEIRRDKYPVEKVCWDEHRAIVLDRLEYLIDLHKAFYY